MSPLTRRLYKDLLRVASRFDANPTSKALIYRNTVPARVGENEEFPASYLSENMSLYYYDEIMTSFLHKKNLYLPSADHISLSQIVRNEFRHNLHEVFSVELETLSAGKEQTARADTAFSLLRKLNSIWSCYKGLERAYAQEYKPYVNPVTLAAALGGLVGGKGGKGGQSETDGRPTAPVVKLLEGPITGGTILAAHPLVQGPMHRACLLVLEHGARGSYGLVINRPTQYLLAEAVKNLPGLITDHFHQNKVAFGGMVRRLQYLHQVPNCGGVPVPGCSTPLFAGGSISKALSVVRRDPELGDSFSFFVGCCKWEKGQLDQELTGGFWVPVQAQPDQLLAMATYPSKTQAQTQSQAQGQSQALTRSRDTGSSCSSSTISDPSSNPSPNTNTDDNTSGVMNPAGLLSPDVVSSSGSSSSSSSSSSSGGDSSNSNSNNSSDSSNSNSNSNNSYNSSESGQGQGQGQGEDQGEGEGRGDGQGEGHTQELHRIDVWKYVMENLGPPFLSLSAIPDWVDTGSVESVDWK